MVMASTVSDSREHQGHFAPLGKLDGVAEEVGEDLAKPAGIAAEGGKHAWLNLPEELKVFSMGAPGQYLQGILHDFPQIKIERLQVKFAGLDF